MPRAIEYTAVLRQMQALGLRSLYHNSGAFGFAPAIATHTIAWIGPPDPTIRPAARQFSRPIPPPHAENLAQLAHSAWERIGGPAWLMPMSHWAYELEFGNPDWLPQSLRGVGIDPRPLESCNQAPAIEFHPPEAAEFVSLLTDLFQLLANSDFALAFPDRPVIATLHHHRQVWWTSIDAELIEQLAGLEIKKPDEPQRAQ